MEKAVTAMPEDAFIRHLEEHHADQIAMSWPASGKHRRFADRGVHETYHDSFLHREPRRAGHDHESYQWTGWEVRGDMGAKGWTQRTACICLHPPQHRADCTGKLGLSITGDTVNSRSAQEQLWGKLVEEVRFLKSLEAFPTAENKKASGIPRAKALAYAEALALILNPISPDVDTIRKEAMRLYREKYDAE